MGARDRGIDETEIEMCVVADQYRARAAIFGDGAAHGAEHVIERVFLRHRQPQWTVDANAGHFQRGLFDVGAGEWGDMREAGLATKQLAVLVDRSEEHTSELQSLMRISYAVFCLKKKKKN